MDVFEFRRKAESKVDEKTERPAEAVTGAAIEVHRHLGPGLPENHYRKALCHELDLRGIPYEYEVPVPVYYKGKLVGEGRMDLLVGKALLLELKVVEMLTQVHVAQAVGYLQAARLELALLINFNVAVLKDGIKRVINAKRVRTSG